MQALVDVERQMLLKDETPYILGVVGLICAIWRWRELLRAATSSTVRQS